MEGPWIRLFAEKPCGRLGGNSRFGIRFCCRQILILVAEMMWSFGTRSLPPTAGETDKLTTSRLTDIEPCTKVCNSLWPVNFAIGQGIRPYL